MRTRLKWLLPFLGALTVAAHARMLPTDTDLKAAYCMGISIAMGPTVEGIAKQLESFPADQYGDARKTIAEIRETVAEKRMNHKRLQLFLLPRLDALDTTGIEIALNRGK